MTAIRENLVQKLSEKANDLCCAYRISSVQNSAKSLDKNCRFFERECIRILKILKSTFYNAQNALDNEIIEQNATKSEFAYNT